MDEMELLLFFFFVVVVFFFFLFFFVFFFFFCFFFTKWSHTNYIIQTCMLLLVFSINYRRTIKVNDIFCLIF